MKVLSIGLNELLPKLSSPQLTASFLPDGVLGCPRLW